MKKFAFFLPQFHEIPENNEWWGEGFTEWTNVKNAKPLFHKHCQPIHPLNNNYYNLLDKKTVEWQTALMKKYRVDGLIYYHYYFCGKMLLEKPAENLLQWKEIVQPFFFCWANHDWNRSWNGSKELLRKQIYGEEKDWEKHFQYLLPFFRDKRYEKKDDKPLFMIFHSDFHEKKLLFEYFDKRCKDYGFKGIYLIETYAGSQNWRSDFNKFQEEICEQTEKIFYREHLVSKNILRGKCYYYPVRIVKKIKKIALHILKKNYISIINGNILYNIIKKEPIKNNIIHGIFFGFDNTPRHKNRGVIVTPPSKKKFMKLMDHLKNEEYIFINAWNEWAEGMVLEPSEEYGYRYLEWIQEWSEKND